jgi:hypothetical protein
VALARRIHRLLNRDGYTIRGVQQLLASGAADGDSGASQEPAGADVPLRPDSRSAVPVEELRAIRRILADALEAG